MRTFNSLLTALMVTFTAVVAVGCAATATASNNGGQTSLSGKKPPTCGTPNTPPC